MASLLSQLPRQRHGRVISGQESPQRFVVRDSHSVHFDDILLTLLQLRPLFVELGAGPDLPLVTQRAKRQMVHRLLSVARLGLMNNRRLLVVMLSAVPVN